MEGEVLFNKGIFVLDIATGSCDDVVGDSGIVINDGVGSMITVSVGGRPLDETADCTMSLQSSRRTENQTEKTILELLHHVLHTV